MKSDVDKITIRMESVCENLNKTEFDDSEKELVMSAVEEVNSVLEYLRELKAYRATGYTPEQIAELNGNRGWIPCSERMPENSNPVLVHAVKKRSDTASLYSAYFENGKGWISVYDRKPMKEYYIEPLYWMPLPEPPVEKGGAE